MTNKQIWQTISLDLKRAANYLVVGSKSKADYYLTEARELYSNQKIEGLIKKIQPYIVFEGNPEDILFGSTLISSRL